MRASPFRLALSLAMTGGVLLAPAAFAGTLDDVRQGGVLRVGTPGDYAPFSLRTADGSYAGADIDEVGRVAGSLGVRVAFVPTSWGKLTEDLKAGKFDIAVGGISVTPARQAIAGFSTVLVRDGKRPVVRCADRDKYTTLDAINQPGVRLVTNPGGSNEAFAHANLPQATLTVVADNKAIPAEIAAGRQDVMVTDGIEADHDALTHPELCAASVAQPFTHFENAFMLQPDPALKAAVDATLDADVASGRWAATLTAAEKQP